MNRLLIPILAMSIASVACADSLKDQIAKVQSQVSQAMVKKDFVAIDRALKPMVAPEFKYSEPGQKPMNYQAMLAGMKSGLGMLKQVTSATSELKSLKVSGNTAVATSTRKLEGIVPGKGTASHKIAYVVMSTDTYRKTSGKWLTVSMSMRTVSATMDGKPLGGR